MVSVIIVVYNASRYLKFAIESVLNQSYKDFEIIAVDDGSTDSTIDILKEYVHLSNFTLIQREHTKNLGGNRNYALKFVKGEIIAFIDGDDIWEEDKLSTQIQYIDKYNMICTNAYLINENNDIISNRYCTIFNGDTEIELKDLLENNFVIGSSVLIRKNAIEGGGYFEDGPDTRAEDYVLWLSYLNKNKIKYINKPLLRYRVHDKNWSNSITNDWIRLLKRTIEVRSAYLVHADSKVRDSARKGCAAMYLELSKVSLKEHNFTDARGYLKNLLSLYDPKFSLKYLRYISGYCYISFLSLIKKPIKI